MTEFATVLADNPGPFTLTGTNTYVIGRDPAWVVDPGPAIDAHADAVAAEVQGRGGVAGILLTHDHGDHAGGVPGLLERLGGSVPVHAVRYAGAGEPLAAGDRVGPFDVVATPGHAPDHVAFVAGEVVFAGDAVLGRGSVFVAPDPGALKGYLEGLARLRALSLRRIAPGHGPLVEDPAAKLDEYIAHRHAREEALIGALGLGRRTVAELLDEAWSDVPDHLRPAAAVTLAAHLDKLDEEGRLPTGVERPSWPR